MYTKNRKKMRYYITADVHGYYSLLRDSLRKSGYFDDAEAHKLIILGDLFDRGAEAREMQDFFLQMMEQEQVILIKGKSLRDLKEKMHEQ